VQWQNPINLLQVSLRCVGARAASTVSATIRNPLNYFRLRL